MNNQRAPIVMVVDDKPDNLHLLEELLEREGYDVRPFPGGELALQAAVLDPPDLVLLDINMPGMNGFEVCRRLKEDERLSAVPVIFLSARVGTRDKLKAFGCGGLDYVTKPFQFEEVLVRVDTHVSLKRVREELKAQKELLEEKVVERTAQLTIAFGSLEDAHRKLKTASLETIVRLSRAAEYRDDDTGAHVLRMSHYAAALARRIGLAEGEIEILLRAAPMHDVGKIGIPDRILLKAGKLTAEEWEVMRRHSALGARILAGSDSEVIRTAETVALTHHERWDGSGYPHGLKGEAIPLTGRLTAVADVFDALTSKRPYKEPFSVEKSVGIIREGAGGHFDPAVVQAFDEITDEILAIRERYQNGEVGFLHSIAGEGQEYGVDSSTV